MANALKVNPATSGANDSTSIERVAAVMHDADGNDITSSNPLPVASTTLTHNDLEGKGEVAVGTTAVELTFSGTTESVIITASITNTGLIYVGKSNVTNLGANAIDFLLPGQSLTIDYNDSTNALYVVASAAAQGVFAGATK